MLFTTSIKNESQSTYIQVSIDSNDIFYAKEEAGLCVLYQAAGRLLPLYTNSTLAAIVALITDGSVRPVTVKNIDGRGDFSTTMLLNGRSIARLVPDTSFVKAICNLNGSYREFLLDHSISYLETWFNVSNVGVTAHASLTGLANDDHPQYHNDARALTWLGTRSTDDLPVSATNIYFTPAEQAKLSGIEAAATADQSATEIENLYDSLVPQVDAGEKAAGSELALRTFSPADIRDMAAIHTITDHGTQTGLSDDDHPQYHNDTRAVTWLGTRTADDLPAGTTNIYFSPTLATKLAGIETGATADQGSSEIKTLYESVTPQVTVPEKTAGTQTAIRIFSPKDIADMATTFGGGGGGGVTTLAALTDTTVGTAADRDLMIYDSGSWVNQALSGDATITVGGVLSLSATGVTAAAYGSSSSSPTFTVNAAGRVTLAANVAIDHDALTSFVANEHIDHTAVSITAGSGLTGGGDISASRSLSVDITGLTSLVTTDTAADLLMIWDDSTSTIKKVLLDDLGIGGGGSSTFSGLTDTNITAPAGGQMALYDGVDSWDNVSMSGDATLASTGVITLANSGVTLGSYGASNAIPVITIDAKGRITVASTAAVDKFGTIRADSGANFTASGDSLVDFAGGNAINTVNTFSVDRTLTINLDINKQSLIGSVDSLNDMLAIWDATDGSIKKVAPGSLGVSTFSGLSDTNISAPAGGHMLLWDGVDSWDNKAVTGDLSITSAGVTSISASTVSGKLLTGLSTATSTAVTASDTILVGIGKLQGQLNNLDAAITLQGTWDASVGTFPGSGTAQAGYSYIVSVGGTVGGITFEINDRIIAITDNASTTVFASNWFKSDYTDQVLSVAGQTGAVTLDTDDVTEATSLYFTEPRVLATTLTGLSAANGTVTAADDVLSATEKILANQNDLLTATGLAIGDTTYGTWTGTTLSDNQPLDVLIQELETAVELAAGGGITAAYGSITDGTTTATASGSDTFKFRSANSAITAAVGSNDATHGDNLLLTFNVGSVDHDSLSGFVANEHIDHSAVSITAGTGLTGGGTIAASRSLSLSHLGIESLIDPNADRIMFWDDSAGATAWLTAGTGLSLAGTTLSLNATGDWTGTFDGQNGSYYLDRTNHTGTQALSTIAGITATTAELNLLDLAGMTPGWALVAATATTAAWGAILGSQITNDLGWLTGNQTVTLSGDVTGSGTTAITATIANDSVTLAKMANMATASFIGRNTAATGDPEVLSTATVKTMLDLTGTNGGDVTLAGTPDYITIAGQVITRALVNLSTHVTGNLPVGNLNSGTGATAGTFWCGDGTWKAPSGGGDALVANPLSQFAATTSAQLAGVISDETGTGALVFGTSPTLVTPILGTPTSVTLTNGTGLPIDAGTTGTLTVARGGTGATTLTGILKGNGTGAFTAVTAPTGALVGTTDTQTLTNKTISFSSNTLTNVMSLTTAQSVTAGIKKTFQANATNSGFSLAGVTANPSTLVAGDIWYRSDSEKLTYRGAAAARSIVDESLTQTLTNKTLTSPILTTPALGTPSSGVLTNATGLPLSTGVTGNLPVGNLNSGTGASATTFWCGDGTWKSLSLTLSQVSDVTASAAELNVFDLAGRTSGDVYVASGAATAAWRQLVLNDMSNVSTSSLVANQVLTWGGANWYNETLNGLLVSYNGTGQALTVADTSVSDAIQTVEDAFVAIDHTKTMIVQLVDETTDCTASTNYTLPSIPTTINGKNLTGFSAHHNSAPAGDGTDVMCYNLTDAADMLTGDVTISAGSKNSGAATIDTAADDVVTNDEIQIRVGPASWTTDPKGFYVKLYFN